MDGDHGRIEPRTSLVSNDIAGLQRRHRWPGLAALGKSVRTRGTATKETTETAYYLLRAAMSPERPGQTARLHWGLEKSSAPALNTVMNEGQTRNRNNNSVYNLAILRPMALNLMQKDRSTVSLRTKFNLAGWKDDFLARLLALT